MNVLKGILAESREYYIKTEKEIIRKLSKLPVETVKKRKINGKIYFYLQKRNNTKIVHKYLGKTYPEQLIRKIKERKKLKEELKKVKESLRILRKTEGKKIV